MSVTELARSAPATVAQRSLSGWGGTAPSRCAVHDARDAAHAEALLAHSGWDHGLIARGAGRSYGDAAQNRGGAVLDMTGCRRIVSLDPQLRLITAEAGATIGELMAALAAHGLTIPVVPGTRHVTVAGAIASDIHGKNHHRDGAFARHVASLRLWTPAHGILELSADGDGELFYATLGGMGLTGVILEATLRAEALPAPWVSTHLERTGGLEQTLEALGGEERHRYSVAWLDMLAPRARMGRALISRADPPVAATSLHTPAAGSDAGGLCRRPLLEIPRGFPGGLLRPSAVRAFNAAKWHSAGASSGRRAVGPYFFPLDAIGRWNRLYGPDGLLQYQFVIPSGEERALRASFELMRERRLPVYLAVFKRFGEEYGGPLSFPLAGWTLAVDVPAAAPGVAVTLDALDELVAACGGRVYLSKDARLRPEALRAMYPRLGRFEEVRSRVDPERVLRSDLGRRLALCGDGP